MHLVLAGLLVTALLAACGSDGPAASADGTSDRVTGDWQLVDGLADDAPLPRVAGLPITLSADRGNGEDVLAGLASCNGYGLEVRYTDTGVETGGLASSAAGCLEVLATVEAAYLGALGRVTRAEQRPGTSLVLTGPGVRLTYEPIPPVLLDDVLDVRWTLESAEPPVPAHPPWPEGTPWIELAANGTITGSTGCRQYDGRWLLWRGNVTITESGYTGQCRPAFYGAENALLLSLTVGLKVDGDHLSVLTRTPSTLTYVRSPA